MAAAINNWGNHYQATIYSATIHQTEITWIGSLDDGISLSDWINIRVHAHTRMHAHAHAHTPPPTHNASVQ